MKNSFTYVEAVQANWAAGVGLVLQRPGYVATLKDNFLPGGIQEEALADFGKGDGAELRDSGGRPAKMRALVSSSALAANFFDAWRNIPKSSLAAALNLEQPIASLRFEYKCQCYPVGPGSPNLDLLLTLADGQRIGIESKFVEPFRTPGVDSALSLKYFPQGTGFWKGLGLGAAQAVVDKMRGQWDYLDAPQLLKHLLGLRTEAPGAKVRLLYLWFDTGLPDALAHHDEIKRFADCISRDDVEFRALTYQSLFRRLVQSGVPPIAAWSEYLGRRYFSLS